MPVCSAPEPMPIDLPTALQLADSSNPVIAVARERVREAFYAYQEARASFLPNLTAGPQYNRHDGEIQNSTGVVFSTNKWNLFIGGGAALHWDTPNLLFTPLIARQVRDAQAAQAAATRNRVELAVVNAYLDLLLVYGELAVNADTISRAAETQHAAEAALRNNLSKNGGADLSRASSELALRQQERIDLTGQAAIASARLARLLLLDPGTDLVPANQDILPVLVVDPAQPLGDLINVAIGNRPELAEGQALAGAARARWQQARLAPLVPKLDVGYAAGGFGGGIDQQLQAFDGRGDGIAMATWELRGMGMANIADTKLRRTQMNEVDLQNRELQAEVSEQVAAATKVSASHQAALHVAGESVRRAVETWETLSKASFGMAVPGGRFDPLEPLTAEQALNSARMNYLNEVIEYTRSQFQLYWAMGNPPLDALPCSSPMPLETPAAPPPRKASPEAK
jgi:outer membrane protein TolC